MSSKKWNVKFSHPLSKIAIIRLKIDGRFLAPNGALTHWYKVAIP